MATRPHVDSALPRAPAAASSLPLALGCAALLLGGVAYAAWSALDTMVLNQAVNEGRAVADMTENVGRWASQYGGVHVRTQGTQAKLPGSFLTRSVYAPDASVAGLNGSAAAAAAAGSERAAMDPVEFYYWKNPALIQRELADVVTSSGSRLQYRMTARSVLNPNNQPTADEVRALDALQGQFKAQPEAAALRSGGSNSNSAPAPLPLEHWRTTGAGQLLYARAVIAQSSCLKCHDSADKAPAFLKTNAVFNGGGGFGYVAGQPAGIISVMVPLPQPWDVLRAGLSPAAWGAGLLALVGAAGLMLVAVRRPARART
jgi:hypothetical protein